MNQEIENNAMFRCTLIIQFQILIRNIYNSLYIWKLSIYNSIVELRNRKWSHVEIAVYSAFVYVN